VTHQWCINHGESTVNCRDDSKIPGWFIHWDKVTTGQIPFTGKSFWSSSQISSPWNAEKKIHTTNRLTVNITSQRHLFQVWNFFLTKYFWLIPQWSQFWIKNSKSLWGSSKRIRRRLKILCDFPFYAFYECLILLRNDTQEFTNLAKNFW